MEPAPAAAILRPETAQGEDGRIGAGEPRQLAEGMAAAGLATVGVGFAHALHTPYWVLRSLVGLPGADQSRLVQAYRLFLIRAAGSPAILSRRKLPFRRLPG